MDGDTASHPLGKFFANREPQAKTFRASLPPVKALENVGKVDRAYPHSLILHRDSAVPDVQPYIPALMLASIRLHVSPIKLGTGSPLYENIPSRQSSE